MQRINFLVKWNKTILTLFLEEDQFQQCVCVCVCVCGNSMTYTPANVAQWDVHKQCSDCTLNE
jgi:hypothetical protein